MKSPLSVIACAGALLLAGCGPGTSEVMQAANKFGLVGRWAPDCSQPGSGAFSVYSAKPDGNLALSENLGLPGDPETSTFQNVTQLDDGGLMLEGVYDASNNAHSRILHRNAQGQIVIWSDNAGGTDVVVNNGAFPRGGGPPLETKCP